jgi:hypothetical protein
MRSLPLLGVVLFGCGRIAFDAVGADDGGSCARTCTAIPPQSGCCPGDSCQIVEYEPRCVRPGARQIGEPCSDGHRCATGLTCEAPYAATDEATCVKLCDVDADCDNGTICAAMSDGAGGVLAAAGGCTSDCMDPLGGAGCSASRTCRFILLVHRTGTARYANFCDIPGPGVQNASCSNNGDCAPGHGCAQSLCRRVCRVGMGDCPSCAALVPRGIVFGVEYGFCL